MSLIGHPWTLSASSVRLNHEALDSTARSRFNNALKTAYYAGTYTALAAISADMNHDMYSFSSWYGARRFLPWHRQYLMECEKLLQTYEPLVRIPYWDFRESHPRPDWVWQPPIVTRGFQGVGDNLPNACSACLPGSLPTGSLPNQQLIEAVENYLDYSYLAAALEDIHYRVLVWCNGTISCVPFAAWDPIFWLLHANVDRIWSDWQVTHDGKPPLSGSQAVLDPWVSTTIVDVDSVINLGYRYG